MSKVSFLAIENLKPGENARLFFRAVKEFLPYLFCEYALSYNLNSETELYSDIRQCIQEQIISTSDLLEKLKANEKANEMISLFPDSDDIDEWKNIFSKCYWESDEESNTITINDLKFISKKLFVTLLDVDGKYYAYKYAYDKDIGVCTFESFNTEIPPVDPIEIDNPFIFSQSQDNFFEERTKAETFELTEEEFFELESIKSSDNEQKSAIKAGTDKNIVVLAGAGSGKTRTLVSRLVYLHMVKKIPLDRILLLTFTKNAADNMKARGESILNPIYQQFSNGTERPNIRAKTIDSFIYGILKDCYQEVGFNQEPIFKLDGTQQTKDEFSALVDEVIKDNNMQGIFHRSYDQEGNPNSNFKYLVYDLEKYASGMAINYAGIERLLSEVLNKQIERHTVYNFVYANLLVKNAIYDPSSELKNIIASRFDCILIDEFQDINILQNETFEPFYNTKMHFTFVGDDDQSIYGWRGSDNSIIKKLVESNNVDTYYLLTNYRNNPNIVKAGNVILNHITGRAKKDKPINPNRKDGPKIRITTYDEKYTNLANEVERLIAGGYSAESICILSRKNQDKDIVARALTACQIPVARERIKIDVNDNYKLMKAIISVLNEYNMVAACREIKRICDYFDCTERFVSQVVLGKKKPTEELKYVALLSDEIRNNNIDNMAKVVYLYSLKAGELFEKSINDRHSDPVFETFELFCSNNSAPWPISAKQLKDLFRMFEDTTRKENQNGGDLEKGVKISTIHSTKGLEYDVVIITGLSLGKYPSTEQIDKNFNARNAQLHTLENSRTALENLQKSVKQEDYITMLQECLSPIFDKKEAKAMKEFKQEIALCGSRDIMGLTAKGVECFLDSYKYYIAPLEKDYNDSQAKINKQGMMYREREEILSEEISLLEQGEEDSNSKRSDLKTVAKKLEALIRRHKKSKQRFTQFEESIKTIKSHYHTCHAANSYLSEVRKLNEIEKLKQQLIEERERSVNEERRLFYVALTRARDILYLCHETGANESQFISVIPDELKEEKAILTKEDEREFLRLKKVLSAETKKEKVNDEIVSANTDKLVDNTNFKKYIAEHIKEFIAHNPIYKDLPEKAAEYFVKAMGLYYLGNLTGSDFKTEFAHNMQRMAESMLFDISGKKAKLFKTDDEDLAKTVADEINHISKKCVTSPINRKYVIDLLTKDSKFGDDLLSLKSAGIFHYIVRSGRYSIPAEVINSWGKKIMLDDADKFLVAVTDIANIRNVLIHPSDKKWHDDPIPIILTDMETVVKNCKGTNALKPPKNDERKLHSYDIKVGVKVEHCHYGIGTVISDYEQSFTVNFTGVGNKVFMKYSAEKFFKKV